MITAPFKIVLIEDDLNLGASVVELLFLNNFEVSWLKNGVEALDYLQNNIPDIIISDLMMPLMNGEELFLKIRKIKKFNTIPFIIITANSNDEVRYRQLKNGVNDYIMKPFKVKEMIFKINNILALKKQIENKFTPDPFSKVTIKLSEKDFILSINAILSKGMKSTMDINEIANSLHFSRSTLDKKIRKRTNKNISQYIREFKLDYAIKLINLGERNIQFLVDETGFNSFSYFSTSFKNYVGQSPTDYIKAL
ncbi:response regulator [Flavobacterium frigoris]|uniref:Two-component system sensor histidine kinase/response regulator, hybrid ('one component system') n=1 Tax=Flavobacterium frigoris (strain PS1) TaxID=1086011 RepID=H7FQV6_FLAFP|nr:response regulator [Flavobacterium frigoris]EIA09093.1 two-component system sensor histidine kinase/response regulator, hybrid ('one component system') [Flavobacterium frigoris PS1]